MSAKPHTTTKHAPRHVKPPLTADYDAVIKQMRNDIFMICWRMDFTVKDALTASRSGLHELAQGHLQEMHRILESTMDRYR